MKKQLCLAVAVLATGLLQSQGVAAQAQPVADFREAVTQAVLTNPRVNAAWYNFEATREAQRAAEGGYFPSVDLSSEIGREERETPLVDLGSYTRDATLSRKCCLMASPPVKTCVPSDSPS